jgi:hypothetical protein
MNMHIMATVAGISISVPETDFKPNLKTTN